MSQDHPASGGTPRTPSLIGNDLKGNFAELWTSLKERAIHTFDKLHRDELLEVKTFDELKALLRRAYSYDDARLDAEIDRFVNEGGSSHEGN